MRRILLNISVVLIAVASIFSCSDWTQVEAENFYEPLPESYYENLRAYKKSDHAIMFGWFGNWTGQGASLSGSLMGLPDSVDFVSIWGNWWNLDPMRMEDKRLAKELKGTRALLCWIIQDIGDQLTPKDFEGTAKEYWGWIDGDTASMTTAIQKYAGAIIDTMNKYDYDGFDIDYEPGYGHSGSMGGQDWPMMVFVEELGKAMGPKSGTDRLLVVDGEPQRMPSESAEYFDYFIVQAYGNLGYGGDSDLDNRLQMTIDNFDGYMDAEEVARRYVVTENFESFASTGGVTYTDRYGNVFASSLVGMASWTPIVNGKAVRSGGCGSFHIEYDYPGSSEYQFTRQAIQVMNPAVR